MFGRVAACGIIAFLLVVPAHSSGETKAFADASAASVVFAMTHSQSQEPVQDQLLDDAQTPAKVATLVPADPSFQSPAGAVPGIQSSALAEPFGLKAVPVEGGQLLAKWTGVEADINAESKILARCHDNAESCPSSAKNFLAIIAEGRAHTGRSRIGVINRAINLAIQPMSDLAQWGVPNRWIAPLVTLTTGRGNCKDYAIAKYVALREAGVADDDVRLVIVRNLAADEDHAVTAVRLDGNWIMLDNRWLTLVEDNEMDRVIPLFVLDDAGVRQFVPAIKPAVRQASAARQGVAPVSL
jgi:predicted transglutaminase-like cysteine proteinase